MRNLTLTSLTISLLSLGAHGRQTDFNAVQNAGAQAIQKMAGCYLVDYNYTETESLKPGYQRDSRVYDVNKSKAVKEWIYSEEISPRRIRLQHILFATDLGGKLIPDSLLKHHAEDWEVAAPFMYEFVRPSMWTVVKLSQDSASWTRRITNLDDGLRYQCSSPWKLDSAYPEWSCDNYSPIPGREFRDMSRKDYNALERSSRIVIYNGSWLERQSNTKVIELNGTRTPLAKEVGKNWYVRLPDSECFAVHDFVSSRKMFWAILRETWDEVLIGDQPFLEKVIPSQPPRYAKMMEVEKSFLGQDLRRSEVRDKARQEILKVIEEYRETSGLSQAAGN